MDEKKTIKVSFGTAVCFFIILFLIIAIGITYYLGFVKDSQKITELENENNTLNEISDNILENINSNNIKENIVENNEKEDNEYSKYIGKWIDTNECSELNILAIGNEQLAFSWAIYRLASIDNTVIPIENHKAEFYFQGYDDKNYNSKQDEGEHFYRRATIQLENTSINIKIENVTASEYDITRERKFIADESIYIYNINESNNTIAVNKDYTTVDNAYVVNLINELNDKAEKNSIIYELRVRDISKDDKNNKYIIIADYNNPLEITQEEYNTLVKTGDCSNILHLTGSYVKTSDLYGDGHGYGFVELYGEDHPGKSVYEIVKTDKGYAFVALAGPAYPLGSSSKKIGFYMDGTDKIYVYNEGEKTLKEYAETLKQKLSGETLPIVTVEYNNGTVSLNMSGK